MRIIALLPLLALFAATPLAAQTAKQPAAKQQPAPAPPPPPAEEKPAPYDAQLTRLAEVLGSIQYLRTLCGAPASDWRRSMQQLLDADTANEPKRRERLTAAFNRGYRSFAAVHTSCTDAARTAEQRYRAEGATLATEIAARFGN
ncbi:TIGR02301 family protein [Neorhizobium sp. DT-125]|uniref:TIGR02301 family protein n=1 Tax=Neorhizobium sp. DT-125 TaxID=3396163 RepID=UPI003F1B46F5